MPARTSAPRPALRPLHLAAEIGGPPRYDAAHHTTLARLAEGGALDFVTLGDSYARPGPDALAVLARVAPATRRIGLVPTATATHAEPSRLSSAVATLDWVSRGRAGWRLGVSATEAEARLFGRRPAASADALWDGAGACAEVCARHWDHWEPPQGHPVVVIDCTPEPARAVAARHADVVLVRAATPERTAAIRDDVRRRAVAYGRDPDALLVFAALTVDLGDAETAPEPGLADEPPPADRGTYYRGGPVDLAALITRWYRAGAVDGFHLTPITPGRDLERIVNGTVALLQHRSLFRTFYPGGTLREHLGLARPARRYASAGARA